MSTWMKKTFSAEGVTEFPPGPSLQRLRDKYQKDNGVVLAMDVSWSMEGEIDEAIRGCLNFVDEALSGGYFVGVMFWSSMVESSLDLTKDLDALHRFVKSARLGGGTDVLPALKRGREMLMRYKLEDRVVAVFGDGDLGPNQTKAVNYSKQLSSEGIRIITMGLGPSSSKALNAISTESNNEASREANSATLARDIRSMATGLSMRARGK